MRVLVTNPGLKVSIQKLTVLNIKLKSSFQVESLNESSLMERQCISNAGQLNPFRCDPDAHFRMLRHLILDYIS